MQRQRVRVKIQPVKPAVVCIVGPTAIGKTALAIKLARRLGGEIISADSMQVYKGMRTLSQAPTAEECDGIRHHLLGVLSPAQEYSVAQFRRRANRLIKEIIRRKHLPIIVGGSGLYIKALLDGLFPAPAADKHFRTRMQRRVRRSGSPALHAYLAKRDPHAAALIHPNDARRIIRALEIMHATGTTVTALKAKTRGIIADYAVTVVGLTRARADLYAQIDARVDAMFTDGVVDEVRRLLRRPLSKTASGALGIREIAAYLAGTATEPEARAALKQNTRRFAKRQWTWFNHDPHVVWYDRNRHTPGGIIASIIRKLK